MVPRLCATIQKEAKTRSSMLTSATIHSFRSCENVQLQNVGTILMLVGRNGVGKTNILRAIEWAAQAALATSAVSPETLYGFGSSRVTLSFDLQGKSLEYDIESGLALKQNRTGSFDPDHVFNESLSLVLTDGSKQIIFSRHGEDLIVGEDRKALRVSAPSASSNAILSVAPDHPVAELVRAFLDFVRGVRYYPLEEMPPSSSSSFISSNEFAVWRAGAVPATGSIPVYQIVQLYLDSPETFAELKSLLGPDGLNIIDDVAVAELDLPSGTPDGTQISEKNRVYFVQFRPSNCSEKSGFGYHNLSFGTRRILRMLLALLFDRTTISLIEQPEDGIHSGLLHQFLPLLRAYANPRQFFVASHSTEVLNRARADEIRLIDMDEGRTSARSLSVTELAAAKKFMEENGPLADFIESMEA